MSDEQFCEGPILKGLKRNDMTMSSTSRQSILGVPREIPQDQATSIVSQTEAVSTATKKKKVSKSKPEPTEDEIRTRRHELYKKWLRNYPYLKPWLHFDNSKLYCRLCLKHGYEHKKWTQNGYDDFDISHVNQHEKKTDHICAKQLEDLHLMEVKTYLGHLKANNLQFYSEKEKKSPFQSTYQENRIIPVMVNVYWTAKHIYHYTKSKEVHELVDYQLTYFVENIIADFVTEKDLKDIKKITPLSVNYRSDTSSKDFLKAFNEFLTNQLLDSVKKSPFIGISLDESSDTSNKKILLIYIKYYSEEECQFLNKLLAVKYMGECTGENVFKAVDEILTLYNLYEKLLFVATDGAKNMRGPYIGFVKFLRDKAPSVIDIHCLNHQLALGSNDLFNTFPTLSEVYTVVYNVTALIKSSPKQEALFKTLQEIEEVPPHNLILPFKVRWFSMIPALTRFLEQFPAIIMFLRKTDLNIKVHYLSKLSQFQTVALAHYLLDLLRLLEEINFSLQSNEITLNTVLRGLKQSIEKIKMNFTNSSLNYGDCLLRFLTTLETENNSFHGIRYEHDRRDDEDVKNLIRESSKHIIQDLESRFPESKVLDHLAILDPIQIQALSQQGLKNYGSSQVKKLKEFIDQSSILKDSINSASLINEFDSYKIFVHSLGVNANVHRSLELNIKKQHPNIFKCYQLYNLIPLSNAEVERGFSKVGLIKTELASTMSEETLEEVLKINILGPDIEDFKFAEVFKIWKDKKERRRLFIA